MHVVEVQTNSIMLHLCRRKVCYVGVKKSVTCMLLKLRHTVSYYMCVGGSHVVWVLARKSVTCLLSKFRQTVSCYFCEGGNHIMWVLGSIYTFSLSLIPNQFYLRLSISLLYVKMNPS